MDDTVIKQKIQKACFEPRAPEALIQKVILRGRAITMGLLALKQLETASAEEMGKLASFVLIGQLAAVSDLPKGADLEQLASQLEQEPAFVSALRGGNVVRRLNSGELIRKIVGQKLIADEPSHPIGIPVKDTSKVPGGG